MVTKKFRKQISSPHLKPKSDWKYRIKYNLIIFINKLCTILVQWFTVIECDLLFSSYMSSEV